MSIGTLRCVAINVTDFGVAYRFWSALTGLDVLGPEEGWHGWLGYLGTTEPRRHEMILVHSDRAPIEAEPPTHHRTNCVHLDITPAHGVDEAIEATLELGGRVKKPPSLYPRPRAGSGEEPLIDWAVMQDPFGNEFCFVHDLTPEQSAAAVEAAERGVVGDHELRAAAGQTAPR
jgi:hypothetical protein